MHKFLKQVAGLMLFMAAHASAAAQGDTVPLNPAEEMPPDSVFQTVPHYDQTEEHYFNQVTAIPTVESRKIPDKLVDSIRADEDYWYANKAPDRRKAPTPKKGITSQSWFKSIFWILLTVGFVALLIWFLATSNIRLFRRPLKGRDEGGMNEIPTENIFEIDYEAEIEQAIASGNYRVAVRLLYLRTLKLLSQKELISYTHEKTNSDYLQQLAGTALYKDFFRLTRHFEYTWYGQFELSPEGFRVMQNHFADFKQQLPS
jgi:hypothetical protein